VNLFTGYEQYENYQGTPLAERVRPEKLEDFLGQEKIIGPGKPLAEEITLLPDQSCLKCFSYF